MRLPLRRDGLSRRIWAGAAGSALLVVAGCAATSYTMPYEAGPERPSDPVSRGADVYAQSCAGCHGENGEGTEGRPKLVGAGAIPPDPTGARKVPIRTAQDLFAFVKSDMPPIAPGSLDDDQYWAVVTYLAKANGADLHGQAVGPKNAGSIQIHR